MSDNEKETKLRGAAERVRNAKRELWLALKSADNLGLEIDDCDEVAHWTLCEEPPATIFEHVERKEF